MKHGEQRDESTLRNEGVEKRRTEKERGGGHGEVGWVEVISRLPGN